MKRVSVGVLPNGVRWYTQFDPKSHVSGVGVRIGSIYDPPQLCGMNHLVEHVLANYGYENELKCVEYGCGPDEDINIRVDRSSTFYGNSLLLRREYTLDLFSIFASAVRDPLPRVTEALLLRERAAVLNEYYLRGKDRLEDEIEDIVCKYLYTSNPARNRIDCEPEELRAMTVTDVTHYIAKHYSASNIFTVFLCVPFQRARRLTEEYFGDLPASTSERLRIDEIRPMLATVKYVEVERRGIHQHHIAVAFPTFPMGHRDDEALELLAQILQWRLRQRIRENNYEWEKGAYRTLTSTPRSFAHGIFYAYFATRSKVFVEESINIVLEECERLKQQCISDQEIVAMYNKLHDQYVEAFTTTPNLLSEMIIEAACNGDEDMARLNSYLGRLSRVGPKTLCRVANEYLTAKNCLIVVIKPDENQEPNEKVIIRP